MNATVRISVAVISVTILVLYISATVSLHACNTRSIPLQLFHICLQLSVYSTATVSIFVAVISVAILVLYMAATVSQYLKPSLYYGGNCFYTQLKNICISMQLSLSPML